MLTGTVILFGLSAFALGGAMVNWAWARTEYTRAKAAHEVADAEWDKANAQFQRGIEFLEECRKIYIGRH